jgi:hypothetical protein
MAQGHVSVVKTEDERLDVVGGAGSGGGVTHMPDGPIPFETLDFTFIAEHLRQQAHSAMTGQVAVVIGYDAGPLLTTMLQCVQTEVGESGGVGMTPHAEDATFFVNVFEFS